LLLLIIPDWYILQATHRNTSNKREREGIMTKMAQPLQAKHKPQEYADVIGNHAAIETILAHVADNRSSYMGLAFGLFGASGQGKGVLTDCMIAHCESLIGDKLEVVYITP